MRGWLRALRWTAGLRHKLLAGLWLAVVGLLGCYQPQLAPQTAALHRLPTPETHRPGMPVPNFAPRPLELPVQSTADVDPLKFPWPADEDLAEWKAVVLHHTASRSGSVKAIHEAHLKNKDTNGRAWLGIGYHFVIGNGHGMPDGEIEPTFRWREQLQGAHAGAAWHNKHGVGVCLVGDFEQEPPTERQMQAARRLTRWLQREFGIPSGNVIGHKDVKATECPGKLFPLAEFRRSLFTADGLSPQLSQVSFSASPAEHRPSKETIEP